MEDKSYSVDSSDDINIEEEEQIEENHSEYFMSVYFYHGGVSFLLWLV